MKIVKDDNRMVEQQRVFLSKDLSTSITITNVTDDIGLVANKGIKALLQLLEDGASNNVMATFILLIY